MENIYFGYMTESERADAVEEATLNNEFDKLQMLFDMRTMQFNQNCKDAELRVLAESGTYDDLQYLIEAATGEAQEQKEGILQKIVNVLKSIWDSIKKAWNNLFGKGDPQQEIEMSKADFDHLNALEKIKGDINAIASDVSSGNWANIPNRLGGVKSIIAGITAVGAGAAVTGGVVKLSRGEFEGKLKPVSDAISTLSNAIQTKLDSLIAKLPPEAQNLANKAMTSLKTLASDLKGIANKFMGYLKGAGETVKDVAKNVATDVKEVVTGTSELVQKKNGNFYYSRDNVWRVSKQGEIRKKNEKGKYEKVDEASIPVPIKKAAQKVLDAIANQNQAATEGAEEYALDMNDIREVLGEAYQVECTEDYIFIIEGVEISREDSIFGSSVESDIEVTESIDENTDKSEFDRLADMINNL